ncbi:hypothetical protein R3P38DRAFT_2831314 [Favolaschia claudopus]|uniref:Uncharacterized protein n=1 Tax=Favolaschia claudopus TaxID=2862362 RepID=A0AAW0EBY2_9AGAR
MAAHHLLLLTLTFLCCTTCNALPIPPESHSAPSLIVPFVVLAILLSTVLLLLFVKRVYARKSYQARQNHSVVSFPTASLESVPSHKEKPGFFVGLLGSPSVEVQCALENSEWKENKQSSFTYHLHTDSRRKKMEYPSVLDISSRLRQRSTSSSSRRVSDTKPVLLRAPHSFEMPSLPARAHVKPPMPPHSRRFSLPEMNRSMPQDASHRRHSSLKSARSRRSVSFSPGGPSPKSVGSTRRRHPSLSSSPRFSECSTSPTPSFTSTFNPCSPKPDSRHSRSFIPPLPPLPFITSPPSPTLRAGPIEISHPYALAPRSKQNSLPSPSQTDPKICEQAHRPVAVSVSIPGPNIEHISSEHPPPQKLSPTLASFPVPPPLHSILKPKFKIRSRRSPSIGAPGPSPLRSMILPESQDSELSSYAQTGGLGFTKSASNSHSITRKGVSPRNPVDDDDADELLEIIRELVEETNDWDQGTVFMNQSFKDLLQESGITPANSATGGFMDLEDEMRKERAGDHHSRSPDFDLELLNLDIFKRGSPYSFLTSDANNTTNVGKQGQRCRNGVVIQ